MYAVSDASYYISLVGDGREEEDLCPVFSGGHSLINIPNRN